MQLSRQQSNLENLSKLLQSNNHRKILQRGFALLKGNNGEVISSIDEIKREEEILVEVSDGEIKLHTQSRQTSLL